jgi:enoyl-CoA hydratase/carnithine racemase
MGSVALVHSEPGRVWRLILNRPEASNAVSGPMLGDLLRALGEAAADPQVRVILLTGDGPHFCAGADLGELDGAEPEGFRYDRALEEVLAAIGEHPVPVVAAVQGATLGAGCQLVTACDLAVAATDARLGVPSARLGIVIGFENVQRLVLAVGPKRAAAMLIAGRELSGEEAATWGLVDQAVSPDQLRARAEAVADEIAAGAPLSVRASKRGIRAVLSKLSIDRATEAHRILDFDMMAADALGSEDLGEGLRAFRERRPPEFRGR